MLPGWLHLLCPSKTIKVGWQWSQWDQEVTDSTDAGLRSDWEHLPFHIWYFPCRLVSHTYSNAVWWKRSANTSPCAELTEKQFPNLGWKHVGTSSKFKIRFKRSQGFLCMKITYFKLELLPYNSSPITKPKKHKTTKICTCLVCSRGHTTLLTVPRNLISGTGGRYPVLTPRDPKFAISIHSLYNRFQDN